MSKNWWKVKSLKNEEQKVRSLKISELDVRGDFGSYKKVLETDVLDNSMLEHHNDLEPNSKLLYIKNLLNISHKKNYKMYHFSYSQQRISEPARGILGYPTKS